MPSYGHNAAALLLHALVGGGEEGAALGDALAAVVVKGVIFIVAGLSAQRAHTHRKALKSDVVWFIHRR